MKKNQSTIQPQNHTTILIIGGGMIGLSQAVALARAGFAVTLIDREDYKNQTLPAFDGRVSAIAWRSHKFLEEVGVWKDMKKYAEPILDIRVSDNNSSLFLHFDHAQIGDDPFGYIVENRYTRIALIKAAQKYKNLKILAPAEIGAWNMEHCTLEVKQKNKSPITIHYSLLIAADGKNSTIRKLAGIKVFRRNYNQHGIVCTIAHEKPHGGLAHEKFLPVGPFAVLPMRRIEHVSLNMDKKKNKKSSMLHAPISNLSSLVWTEPSEIANIYMKMPETDFVNEIKKRVNYLGDVKLASQRFSYKLELMHAEKYSGKNFVLVGDAAHAIHPIAGQGVNLGFRDVIALTKLISDAAKLGLPVGSHFVTSEYENLRRGDNGLMIFATDTLNRLFSNTIFPLRLARDLGLGIVNQIPPLRKFFMRYASGSFHIN